MHKEYTVVHKIINLLVRLKIDMQKDGVICMALSNPIKKIF